ncbi:hypothetical protein SAMN05421839_11057 [Halolactibacillus halophilus]|uniref:Uncharacterized protein n=1 Tax=Halolactibacillus halophilus TaxID=306540 RepID=A0A1I5NPI7_9BACI|nr:hypothetical protein [Halolactibacillus halophilus]GEM01416.1 hypothetical protein HHA03_09480 [Halolactibacillus halophilus]SFP23723.1 hypothetical protein SAMN05421839_11057 [Halolactibacillus halophilus]
MKNKDIQRTIIYILGAIVGLAIVSLLKEQNHLTNDNLFNILIIVIIGSLIGIKLRKIFKKSKKPEL